MPPANVLHTHTHARIHTYTHTHAHAHTCTHTHTHTHTHQSLNLVLGSGQNWMEVAYGTQAGSVRVVVRHPENIGQAPQIYQSYSVHTCPILRVVLGEKHLISGEHVVSCPDPLTWVKRGRCSERHFVVKASLSKLTVSIRLQESFCFHDISDCILNQMEGSQVPRPEGSLVPKPHPLGRVV